MTPTLFKNRTVAGQLLATNLTAYRNRPEVLVLALPRGGVPVAFEVAQALNAPLDVFLVRKLGVPGQQELAMGAIASGGVRVLNHKVVQELHISEEVIEQVAAEEQQELERRAHLYRDDRPAADLRERIVILIDDGIATGSTMRAAVTATRQQGAERVVVAVPVSSIEACRQIGAEVDEMICSTTPEPFRAVGIWYKHFLQTTDEEVRDLLKQAALG